MTPWPRLIAQSTRTSLRRWPAFTRVFSRLPQSVVGLSIGYVTPSVGIRTASAEFCVHRIAGDYVHRRSCFMRRFRYLTLIGLSVLAALVNILPAHAAVNHNE